ncbi:mannitol operon repressor [Vibrio ponticus]|nr:mannitol operon repressor [Vibrio ponticus]
MRGFFVAAVDVFNDSIDALIQRIFRKDNFAVQSVVGPLLQDSGPLGDLSVRLKLLYGLGVLPDDVYHDIDSIIKLKHKLNSEEKDFAFTDPKVLEAIKQLHLVNKMSMVQLEVSEPDDDIDLEFYQLQLQRQQQIIKSGCHWRSLVSAMNSTKRAHFNPSVQPSSLNLEESMMLKAILFDMDGLIFDTEAIYKQSWQYAAQEQQLDLSDEFYQRFIGVQDPDCEQMLGQHFGKQIDMARYIKVRNQHFHHQRQAGVALKPGFVELLHAIKQLGLTTAIVTSSQRPEVEFNFAPTPYLSQFDLIISAEDVALGKPHPDCYLLACQRLGLAANECLVLEDSNNGIRAALAAGCQAVMIPDLLPPESELVCDITICQSLTEVIALLN